jgi:hypothetical protein
MVPSSKVPSSKVSNIKVPINEDNSSNLTINEDDSSSILSTRVPSSRVPSNRVSTIRVPIDEDNSTNVTINEDDSSSILGSRVPSSRVPSSRVPSSRVPSNRVPSNRVPSNIPINNRSENDTIVTDNTSIDDIFVDSKQKASLKTKPQNNTPKIKNINLNNNSENIYQNISSSTIVPTNTSFKFRPIENNLSPINIMSDLGLNITDSSIQSMDDNQVAELISRIITTKSQQNIQQIINKRATALQTNVSKLLQEKLQSQSSPIKQQNDEDDSIQNGGFFIPKLRNIYYGGDETSTENNNVNAVDLSETSNSVLPITEAPSKVKNSSENNLDELPLAEAPKVKKSSENNLAELPLAEAPKVKKSSENNLAELPLAEAPKIVSNKNAVSSNADLESETSQANTLPNTESLSTTSEDCENKNSKYYLDSEDFYTTTIFEGESETKGVFNDIASGAKKLFNYISKSLN